MKIKHLEINGYKNLHNIKLSFQEDSAVNAIIGNNGSGKSNILEAIVRIFASIQEGVPELFDYQIQYLMDENEYVMSQLNSEMTCLKNGKKIVKRDLAAAVPSTIFLYYCGETNRMKHLSARFIDAAFEKSLKSDGEIVIKYLSYLELRDFPCALLANAAYKNSIYQKVCDLIGIEEIGAPISLHLKRPNWSKTAPINENSFWNAQGSVAKLLHTFKDIGIMKIVDKDYATIKIDSLSELRKASENPFNLLSMLKLLMQAGVLESVDFDIVKEGQTIASDDLSEGEKQLALLLCFLEATKEYRALFLLDEFDSYLHPSWQRKFAEIIADIDIRGQVLFTTHSPLTLGKMQQDNIRIIKNGEVFIPSVGTYNRDISEVLEEIMEVGLRPIEVQKCIDSFKAAVLFKKKEQAFTHYETLKSLLSKSDPYWSTADVLMARLGD